MLSRRTQIFGTLTYAIYLWHTPIAVVYSKSMTAPISANGTMAATLVSGIAVILFAYITNLAIEKPFERMKAKPRRPMLQAIPPTI